jgi:hypothetical protein
MENGMKMMKYIVATKRSVDWNVEVGDEVRILHSNLVGKVISISQKGTVTHSILLDVEGNLGYYYPQKLDLVLREEERLGDFTKLLLKVMYYGSPQYTGEVIFTDAEEAMLLYATEKILHPDFKIEDVTQ